jgi:uncharacterized protein YbjT (DUF2867 family)
MVSAFSQVKNHGADPTLFEPPREDSLWRCQLEMAPEWRGEVAPSCRATPLMSAVNVAERLCKRGGATALCLAPDSPGSPDHMKIAVIGATGTVGSHVASKLEGQGIEVVKVSRSNGVDLINADGLREALANVDVAIDTSNPFPPDNSIDLQDALTRSARNVVDACSSEGVGHLVFLSVTAVENPVFDEFPYYAAKRAQEQIVTESALSSTIVKSAQFDEFAINPAAVTISDDDVSVQDWLVQPIAADSVADVLIQIALGDHRPATRTIAGPEPIRLPGLTTRLLQDHHDSRPVRTTAPHLPELAQGVLLAPDDAEIVGPSIGEWLQTASARDTWRQTTSNQS